MSAITTHVLDTACGRPAAGLAVTLERRGDDGGFVPLGSGSTDGDGRLRTLLPAGQPVAPGLYRLTFATAPYFAGRGVSTFYPEVAILFSVAGAGEHYHVPLLLSPFGYSTYRGS